MGRHHGCEPYLSFTQTAASRYASQTILLMRRLHEVATVNSNILNLEGNKFQDRVDDRAVNLAQFWSICTSDILRNVETCWLTTSSLNGYEPSAWSVT
jgi:hypothetical protein